MFLQTDHVHVRCSCGKGCQSCNVRLRAQSFKCAFLEILENVPTPKSHFKKQAQLTLLIAAI